MKKFLFIFGLIATLALSTGANWLFIKSGVVWDPSNKSNLVLWYRGDSNTQTAGLVTQATDKSASAINLTFPLTRQPTYNATQLNGQPCWSGNVARTVTGTSASTTVIFDPAQEYSTVFVIKGVRESTGDFTQWGSAYSTASIMWVLYTVNTLTSYKDLNWGSTTGNEIGVTTFDYYTNPVWIAIDYNGGGVATTTNWHAWRNGVSQTLVQSSTAGSTNKTALFEYGTSSKSVNASGYFCESFTYKGTGSQFSGTDITNIGSYMTSRYAF